MTCYIYGLALPSWAINISVPQFPYESNGTTNNSFPIPRGSPASPRVSGSSKGIMDVDALCKSRMLYKCQALICVDSKPPLEVMVLPKTNPLGSKPAFPKPLQARRQFDAHKGLLWRI